MASSWEANRGRTVYLAAKCSHSIKRSKRAKSQLFQDKFTQKLLNRGGDIFKEIKKFRRQGTTISNCIDGEVGAQNIANHFQEINENLYSQYSLREDFDKVQQNIQERVHHGLQDDISQSKMH